MEGLTPVQISELVTLLEDAISACSLRLEQGVGGEDQARVYNEIDHLEAELAWIQWMREYNPEHEENGFPPAAVEEHVQGMRAWVERWRARLEQPAGPADENYTGSLRDSIAIVGSILSLFEQVRGAN